MALFLGEKKLLAGGGLFFTGKQPGDGGVIVLANNQIGSFF